MHLAIDAVGAKHSGAARVALDLIEEAIRDERWHLITVFASPRSLRNFDFPDEPHLQVVERPLEEKNYLARLYWFEWGLGRAAESVKADVLICLSNSGQGTKSVPHVVLIHQSLPFIRDALATLDVKERIRMRFIRFVMWRSCRTACATVVQTNVMAQAVIDAYHLDSKSVHVITPDTKIQAPPHGDEIPDRIRPMLAVPADKRLLYIGNSSPYKSLETLVNGITILRHRIPEATLFMTLAESHPFAGVAGVICLGSLNREEVSYAYGLATLFVVASLAEASPLPLLEAQSLNVPILVADRPYAREICQDSAAYFSPKDAHDFARQAELLLDDSAHRARLSQRGRELIKARLNSQPYKQFLELSFQCIELGRSKQS